MEFSKWLGLQEADNFTKPSGTNQVNAPSAVDRTAPHNPAIAGKIGPSGNASGVMHSNPQIQHVLQELNRMNKEVRAVLDIINKSGHFDQYPQFKKPFLEKIRNAADGITAAHAIISADPGYRPPAEQGGTRTTTSRTSVA